MRSGYIPRKSLHTGRSHVVELVHSDFKTNNFLVCSPSEQTLRRHARVTQNSQIGRFGRIFHLVSENFLTFSAGSLPNDWQQASLD